MWPWLPERVVVVHIPCVLTLFLATPRRQMIENVHTLLAGRLRVSRTADPCVAHVADAVGVAPAPARRRLLLTYLLLRHTPAGFG